MEVDLEFAIGRKNHEILYIKTVEMPALLFPGSLIHISLHLDGTVESVDWSLVYEKFSIRLKPHRKLAADKEELLRRLESAGFK